MFVKIGCLLCHLYILLLSFQEIRSFYLGYLCTELRQEIDLEGEIHNQLDGPPNCSPAVREGHTWWWGVLHGEADICSGMSKKEQLQGEVMCFFQNTRA